jgi:hypothetical protein
MDDGTRIQAMKFVFVNKGIYTYGLAAPSAVGGVFRQRWGACLCLLLVLPACARPEETRPPHAGLGVSRAALQAVLARPEFGFSFGESLERGGIPHLTGTVPGKLVALDLVGPPKDLTQVTLMVGVPSTAPLAPPQAPEVLTENVRYLRAVLRQAMPDWQEGGTWLTRQLQRSGERQEVGVRKGHREVVLLAVNRGSMILLNIRVRQMALKRSP